MEGFVPPKPNLQTQDLGQYILRRLPRETCRKLLDGVGLSQCLTIPFAQLNLLRVTWHCISVRHAWGLIHHPAERHGSSASPAKAAVDLKLARTSKANTVSQPIGPLRPVEWNRASLETRWREYKTKCYKPAPLAVGSQATRLRNPKQLAGLLLLPQTSPFASHVLAS